jgi:hypothetical protein
VFCTEGSVVQRLLSSLLLCKNQNIRIHKILILPVVLYGYEIWSVTLRQEHGKDVGEQGAGGGGHVDLTGVTWQEVGENAL